VAGAGQAGLAEGVDLERFDPLGDPAAARRCHELYLAGVPFDDPGLTGLSLPAFTAWLALGWTEDPTEAWLARDGGQVCGWYKISFPERENTQLAFVAPLVGPTHRRRGAGTALIRHAAARVDQRGRMTLAGHTRQGSPGAGFCRALGARPGITEAIRVLRVDAIPAGRLSRLRARAEAAARGYTVLSWEGPVPERYLAALAALNQAAGDAPHDAGTEEQRWDTARVRQSQARVAAQGLRYYTVAARCERTGELAGMSQLGVDPVQPDWGLQELTVVARQHRGHRLGLLVKVVMLQLLAQREPLVERILTGNADSNQHMIAINAELGFQVLDHSLSWQLAVAEVLARPAAAQP